MTKTGDSTTESNTPLPEELVDLESTHQGRKRSPRADRELEDFDRTVVSEDRKPDASSTLVAALIVLKGPELGRYYPLRRNEVVLGRAEDADIVLRDREVSRRHAQIEWVRFSEEPVYAIADQGSTNHVFVNGERVDSAMLRDGDKIQVGDIVLSFELHDALDAKFHTEVRDRIRLDDLTGLLTLESFRVALAWELEKLSNRSKGCAVVMMDLDDFKQLNDRHGHLAGSAVLEEIGELIRTNLRQFDVAARYGGEEFVAYLPETDADEAWTAVERLRQLIEEHRFRHGGESIQLTISMGLSHFPDDGDELIGLIDRADRRLYGAKRAGKNRVSASD